MAGKLMNSIAVTVACVVVIFSLLLIFNSASAQSTDNFEGRAHDAWLTGKIETVLTLNTMLNSFTIDTDVEQGNVTLTGEVSSDVEKALATELVHGIEGVGEINNELSVTGEPGPVEQAQNSLSKATDTLSRWVSNATMTATVKSRLLANSETKGLAIDVDSMDTVVTLSGAVDSAEERMLAESIAKNTEGVMAVQNELIVAGN